MVANTILITTSAGADKTMLLVQGGVTSTAMRPLLDVFWRDIATFIEYAESATIHPFASPLV